MTRLILRAILALAAREFRQRYGEEILGTHDERAAERRGLTERAVFSLREIVGLLAATARFRRVERDWALRHGAPTGGRWFDGLGRDARIGVRSLRRSPGFAFAAIAVLALGIGANSAIFSAVNAFLYRPLPFGESDGLVMLFETNPEFGWEHAQAAPANVLDWREQVEGFDDVAMYSEFVQQAPYVRDGEANLLGVSAVSGNFFDILQVRAELGRGFEWDETWEGASDVLVLSHDAWASKFGGDPAIVDRSLEIGSDTYRVVGVMPRGFDFPSEGSEAWIPYGWAPTARDEVWFRRAHFARAFARLAPGVSTDEANAGLQVVVERLKSDYPETNRVMGAGLMPFRDFLVMDVRAPLYVLLGAVALLLLLACTNVANLMLVRASDRARDVALRIALGAGRRRVARQVLVEGAILAGVGGALGLLIGWIGVRALSLSQPIGIDGVTSMALDARVIGFTVVVAVASALVFGIVPALRAARGDVQEALKDGVRSGGPGRRTLRTAGSLVVSQVAFTLVLVVGAGLMVRTFLALRDVDPGFRTESVLAVRFTIPSSRYADRDNVLAFQEQFADMLEGRPAIERVGTVAQLPLTGQSWSSQFQAEGWPPERVGLEIVHRRADAGYFEALDIPLVRGRMFGQQDAPDGPFVVLINETMARQHFPGEDPVGRRIAYDRAATAQSVWYEVIGIVGDQHQIDPSSPPVAEAFENHRQDWGRSNWFVIRTSGDATHARTAVGAVLEELDPLIPIAEQRALRDVWRSSMARWEFLLTLLTVFAGSAILLATVGVYGVTAQAARKRTHEIGIRIALGARASEVLGLVLRQGLAVVGTGVLVGVALSLVAGRAVGAFLYGVAPADPVTIGAVVVLLSAVAALACLIPAGRATRVDPATSLRAD